MNGLNKYPRTAEAVNELVIALQCSPNEEFAARLISGYCEYSTECPKPVEIRKEIFAKTESEPVTYGALWPGPDEPSHTQLSLLDEINKRRNMKPYSKEDLVKALKLIPEEHFKIRRKELEIALTGIPPTITSCPCPSCVIHGPKVL